MNRLTLDRFKRCGPGVYKCRRPLPSGVITKITTNVPCTFEIRDNFGTLRKWMSNEEMQPLHTNMMPYTSTHLWLLIDGFEAPLVKVHFQDFKRSPSEVVIETVTIDGKPVDLIYANGMVAPKSIRVKG